MIYLSKLLKRSTILYDEKPFVFVDNTKPKEKEPEPTQVQPDFSAIAEQIIADAQRKADQIMKKALSDAAEVEKEGYVKGFNNGLKAAEKENEVELERIKAIISRLDDDSERFYKQEKQNVIDLALNIAEKVVCQKMASDKDIFIKLYEKAVKDLTAQRWIKLSISKHEFEIATAHSDYLVELVSGAERVELVVLDDAPAGTCIVETSEKIVDASVLTQFNVLKNALL